MRNDLKLSDTSKRAFLRLRLRLRLNVRFSLVRSHYQEREFGGAQDMLSHAAHHQASQTAPSMGGHRDQIVPALVLCLLYNCASDVHADDSGRGNADLAIDQAFLQTSGDFLQVCLCFLPGFFAQSRIKVDGELSASYRQVHYPQQVQLNGCGSY